MRTLLLMRGAPGCGKSTYIEQNDLTQYVLSADNIRAMLGYEFESNYAISCGLENKVWEILMNLLEQRMRKGMFTVIDACNSKSEDAQKYRRLADKYRYRIYCVDFTDITPDVCKAQNAQRPLWKQVPESAIDRHYSRFVQPLPNYVTMIKRDELWKLQAPLMDYTSEYKKIKVFGDVHGCYTALMQALGGEELADDTLYIFAGDYIDRGVETGKLLKWMLSVINKPNVIFIEGNHERYLWAWAEGNGIENVTSNTTIKEISEKYSGIKIEDIIEATKNGRFVGYSKTFEKSTLPLIEEEGITKKEIRQLYRKLWQCAWFKFNGQKFLVTHGGLGKMPTNEELYKISTEQMIRGTGRFNDVDEVEINFEASCDDVVQIHGHRNVIDEPIKVSDRTYNLEGSVEFGGELRWVEISADGKKVVVEPYSIVNNVYNGRLMLQVYKNIPITNVSSLLKMFRNVTELVNERERGHISSFNFTKSVFKRASWNDLTIKARGLFINTHTEEIVARSYDKFFNYGEHNSTKLSALTKNLVFPITAYVKENGFLGILGYDKEFDELVIASKSVTTGEYARYFRNLLEKSGVNLDEVKKYLADNEVSMVFEVIDIENDPHIIEYDQSHIVLLDVIKNDIVFNKLSYDEMVKVADKFGFEHKKVAFMIEDMLSLKRLLENEELDDKELSGSGKYKDGYIEGYVFEDMNGFMFKYKLPYYKAWKALRGIIHSTLKYGKWVRTSQLYTKTANDFYQWLRQLYNNPEYRIDEGISMNDKKYKLINLRNKWLMEK